MRTDVSGMPIEWVTYQDAVRLYFNSQIAYTCGSNIMTIHGGINAITNSRSKLEINSIISTYGSNKKHVDQYAPPLNNRTLFNRDDHLCLYCGLKFSSDNLSRDHVTPLFQGGKELATKIMDNMPFKNIGSTLTGLVSGFGGDLTDSMNESFTGGQFKNMLTNVKVPSLLAP